MEERQEYKVNDNINKIEAHMIKITITNKNKARVHEIVREMLRLEALDKLAAGLL